MAGWWRSAHGRPYDSGATWTWRTERAWWWHAWQDDDTFRMDEQGADPTGGWSSADPERSGDGPPPAVALSTEVVAQEPDQYPWACLKPQTSSGESRDLAPDASESREVALDPPSQGNGEEPSDCTLPRSCTKRTAQEEAKLLEKLHAEVVRKFLAQHDPASEESDYDGQEETVADGVNVRPIDPEIGEYDPKTGAVQCLICDRPQNSRAQFFDHVKGKKHWKKHDAYLKNKARRQAEAEQAVMAMPLQ